MLIDAIDAYWRHWCLLTPLMLIDACFFLSSSFFFIVFFFVVVVDDARLSSIPSLHCIDHRLFSFLSRLFVDIRSLCREYWCLGAAVQVRIKFSSDIHTCIHTSIHIHPSTHPFIQTDIKTDWRTDIHTRIHIYIQTHMHKHARSSVLGLEV